MPARMLVKKQLSTRQTRAKTLNEPPENTGFFRPEAQSEVIEISSDSDSDGETVALQNQAKTLKEENTQLKDQLKKTQEEHARLQQEVKHFQQKSTLKDGTIEALENQMKEMELARKEQEVGVQLQAQQEYIQDLLAQYNEVQEENRALKSKPDYTNLMQALNDHATCEICVCVLWKPYVLPGCGHTFCRDCLEDWFDTTLTQHQVQHPDYIPELGILAPLRQRMLNPDPHTQAVARAEALAELAREQLEPTYTCPTCRKQVRSKPAEDFVLKSLVRLIMGAAGQSSPMKEPAAQTGRTNPWAAYFCNTDIW